MPLRFRSYYHWLERSVRDLFLVILAYALVSYLILPAVWRHYEHRPSLETAPKTTESSIGFPGDPLNVALVGTKEELVKAMLLSGWLPADNITFSTSLGIATSVVLNHAYPDAPVSNLYLFGRKQDLAFERVDGRSPRSRHHVRFWLAPLKDDDGSPLWIGAATFDRGIGFNHFTGQITHHIAPDVDTEREAILDDLTKKGQLTTIYQVTGVGANIAARNAQGDWYYTDGELTVGILSAGNVARTKPPDVLSNPAAVDWKNQGWTYLRNLLEPLSSNTLLFNAPAP
jgi:hypothetical protein